MMPARGLNHLAWSLMKNFDQEDTWVVASRRAQPAVKKGASWEAGEQSGGDSLQRRFRPRITIDLHLNSKQGRLTFQFGFCDGDFTPSWLESA